MRGGREGERGAPLSLHSGWEMYFSTVIFGPLHTHAVRFMNDGAAVDYDRIP